MHNNINKKKPNKLEHSKKCPEKFYAVFPAVSIGQLHIFKNLCNNKLLERLSKPTFEYQRHKQKLDKKYRPQIFQLAKKISISEKQINKLLNLKHDSKQSKLKRRLTWLKGEFQKLKGEYQKKLNNLNKKFSSYEKAYNYGDNKSVTLDEIVCRFIEPSSSNVFFRNSRKRAQLFWKYKVFKSLTEAKEKLYNALIKSYSKKESRSRSKKFLKYKLPGYFCGIVEFEYIYYAGHLYAGHLNLVINNCLIYNLEKDLNTFLEKCEKYNKYYQAMIDITLGRRRLLNGLNAKFYNKFSQTNKIKPCEIYRHKHHAQLVLIHKHHAQLVLIIKLMQLINVAGKAVCTDVLMHILSYRLEFSAELGDINTKKVKSKTTQKKVRTRDEIRYMVDKLSTKELRKKIDKFFQLKNRSELVISWEKHLEVSSYFASKRKTQNFIKNKIKPCEIYRYSNSVLRKCHAQLVLIIKLMQLINFSGKYACTNVLMHILSYRPEFSAELGDINTKKVKSKTTQKKVRTRDEIRYMVDKLSTKELRKKIDKFFQLKNRSELVISWEKHLEVSSYFASKFKRSDLIKKFIRPLVSTCKIL
jgi:hypothetical protein